MEILRIFQPVDLTTILLFMFLFCVCYYAMSKPKDIPPGPVILFPGLGNIPNLLYKKNILKSFRDWRVTYGDIFSVYMGHQLIIVLNGYPLIREALVKRGSVFSNRPKNAIFQLRKENGIIFSSGHPWKEQRKTTSTYLQELGFGKRRIEQSISEVVSDFLVNLESKDGAPYDVKEDIHIGVSNVIFQLLASKRFSYQDDTFRQMIRDVNKVAQVYATVVILLDCFPFLKFLPGDMLGLRHVLKTRQITFSYYQNLFDEHKATFDENRRRDILDYFVKDLQKISSDEEDDFLLQMKETVGDLFGAGSETTATTIRWVILFLIRNPEVQHRMRTQIHDKVGKFRVPNLDDRENLPVVEATILEVLRIANVVPLSVPHAVEREIMFKGYRIPQDSTILVNHDSIFSDPQIWTEPDKFLPGRFMDENGRIVKPEEFIPFGIGRRVCLGEALARMELFLFISSMVQRFEFKPVDNETVPGCDGTLGISYIPEDFKFRAVRIT